MAVELSSLKFNCRDCNDGQKMYRGCNGDSKLKYPYGDTVLDVCPVKMLRPETMAYIKFYNWYKKGFLPAPGTVLQQPYKLMKIFDIIEDAEIGVEAERNERMQALQRAR